VRDSPAEKDEAIRLAEKAEKDSREQRKTAEREQRLRMRSEMVGDSRETHTCFGKWFTEKFSVNHFPYFHC
jgi:hypothetical protein